jgi:hypothetical protein
MYSRTQPCLLLGNGVGFANSLCSPTNGTYHCHQPLAAKTIYGADFNLWRSCRPTLQGGLELRRW